VPQSISQSTPAVFESALVVRFQEVVHSEQIWETGVTTPQFSRIAPNGQPPETSQLEHAVLRWKRTVSTPSPRHPDEAAGR